MLGNNNNAPQPGLYNLNSTTLKDLLNEELHSNQKKYIEGKLTLHITIKNVPVLKVIVNPKPPIATSNHKISIQCKESPKKAGRDKNKA